MFHLFRRFALVFGLAVGTMASQLPEYAQQYRQRLGGALDELTRTVTDFDDDAARMSLPRDTAIRRLEQNSDPLVQGRGRFIQETVVRRDRLLAQDQAFHEAGSFSRLSLLARDFDPGIARGAWNRFEPAVPVTGEGFVIGGIGLVLGYLLWHILALPLRLRRTRVIRA